jgi:hypothetical protein
MDDARIDALGHNNAEVHGHHIIIMASRENTKGRNPTE